MVKMILDKAALFIFFHLVLILLPEYNLWVEKRACLQMFLKSQNTDTSFILKTLAGMICQTS